MTSVAVNTHLFVMPSTPNSIKLLPEVPYVREGFNSRPLVCYDSRAFALRKGRRRGLARVEMFQTRLFTTMITLEGKRSYSRSQFHLTDW